MHHMIFYQPMGNKVETFTSNIHVLSYVSLPPYGYRIMWLILSSGLSVGVMCISGPRHLSGSYETFQLSCYSQPWSLILR